MRPLSRRLDALEGELAAAEKRLASVDSSRVFQLSRWPGRMWRDWRGRLGQLLLHSGLHPLYARLRRPAGPDRAYLEWSRDHDAAAAPAVAGPLISVLLPVYNPQREWLEAAVASVRGQTYPQWELCVCDDASADPWVGRYFQELAAVEPRLRFVRAEANRGIAGATNRAGELATGEYLAFLDQDDVLAPSALARVAAELAEAPADLIYSDEDRLDAAGNRAEPIFRPGWSPELLLSCMYMGHLLVARRAAVERAGWLRSAFDGAQDYDLALRLTEGGAMVWHVPRVLYHWRKHAASTAAEAGAKSYTQRAGCAALAAALARRQVAAEVADGPFANTYRVRRRARAAASIVICSRRARLLDRCLRGIDTTTAYPRREIVVVEHVTGDGALGRLLERVHVQRVPYTGGFDFATMNNLGAARASGEVLVFLNDDVVPLEAGWLEALVAQAERPEVGVVGARLVYPTGAIQHAGLALGMGHGVMHPQRDTFGSGYWPWWGLTREVAAVTGACLAVRRELFEQLGGFDTRFPVNYNDADLCLRARAAGYSVIYEAAALLRHDECRTRRPGVRFAERTLWENLWGRPEDPYYSVHLDRESERAGLQRHA